MEVLSHNQFSETLSFNLKVSPNVSDMNPFIVKKLEEAVIRAYNKKVQGEKKLSDKLEKAEKRRAQQMDAKLSKAKEAVAKMTEENIKLKREADETSAQLWRRIDQLNKQLAGEKKEKV